MFEKNSDRESNDNYSDYIVFEKAPFSQCFSSTYLNENPGFSNSSAWKSVFEKLRFLDGLVWTVG